MTKLQRMLTGAAVAVLLVANPGAGAQAQTVIEEWASAKLPSPPALKPATIVPNETALLVMDFTNQTCTKERRQLGGRPLLDHGLRLRAGPRICNQDHGCLLYTSPSPRDRTRSRMPSSA